MYTTLTISPLKLSLDQDNPRFITKNQTQFNQTEIREYLLKFEEIIELATDINQFEGLIPGERILVTKENNEYIVLEGNRRTTALQLLLDPSLIPDAFSKKGSFPMVNANCKKNIKEIEVDLIESRDSSYFSLSKRHINGIKKWSQISKMYFYKNLLNQGYSIKKLAEFSGESKNTILKSLKSYSFFRIIVDNYEDFFPNSIYIATQGETKLKTDLVISRLLPFYEKELNIQYSKSTYEILLPYNKEKAKLLKEILVTIAYYVWDLTILNSRNLNKNIDIDNYFSSDNSNSSNQYQKNIVNLIIKYKNIDFGIDESVQLDINDSDVNTIDEKNDTEKNNESPVTRSNHVSKIDSSSSAVSEPDISSIHQPYPNKPSDEYSINISFYRKKLTCNRYEDFDLFKFIKDVRDSNGKDLKQKVIFNTEKNTLITKNIFSGDAPVGEYSIQVKVKEKNKSVSKLVKLVVKSTQKPIKIEKSKNELFKSYPAFIEKNSEVRIDVTSTINNLMIEIQSLSDPQDYLLMISSSIRQLVELSINEVWKHDYVPNAGNTKGTLEAMITRLLSNPKELREICEVDNKLQYLQTKDFLASLSSTTLISYLNLINHDSSNSTYSDLKEIINKQLTPFLVLMHNLLKYIR